jgi:hypothetical protein
MYYSDGNQVMCGDIVRTRDGVAHYSVVKKTKGTTKITLNNKFSYDPKELTFVRRSPITRYRLLRLNDHPVGRPSPNDTVGMREVLILSAQELEVYDTNYSNDNEFLQAIDDAIKSKKKKSFVGSLWRDIKRSYYDAVAKDT